MGKIKCPRCSCESKGVPYLYQVKGYARCPSCGVGIEYSSNFLKRNIKANSWYIPDGCSVSPKTGNVLCSHRVYKSGRFVSYFFKQLVRHPNPNSQSKREGTLKRALKKD
jgi:hypothetical protein